MFKWIANNFGLRNFLILTIVIVAILGLAKGPAWYKFITRSQYEGICEAQVTNIIAKKSTFQHYNGTNIKTIGYDVSYLYSIGEENFSNKEFLKPGIEIKQLFDLYTSGNYVMVEVRFSEEEPSKSYIVNLHKQK